MEQIDFNSIDTRHLEALAQSVMKAPADERDSPREMLTLIKSGVSRLYETSGGIYLCRKVGRTLMLDAICCYESVQGIAETALLFETFVTELRRVAAEWECDKIKTIVFDDRLTCVIKHLGGRVESVVMTLALEHDDG